MEKQHRGMSVFLDVLLVLLGTFIYAAGLYFFIEPANIAPGGVSGIAVLINYLTHAPIGIVSAAINIPLILLAWRKLDADFARNYTVRPTDIDFGRHMNNVAYIRVLLDCFSAKQIASGTISSIEAHYASPCLEGETLSVYQKQDGNTVRIAIKKQDGKPAVLAAVRFTA